VHAELTLGRGIKVGRHQVELVMRRAGLRGVVGRRKRPRIERPDAIALDLVDRSFARNGPDELWVTDITEHPTREGKVYSAVVLDAFSRRVVGWSIDASPTASLVTNALGMAIEARDPRGTLIHQGTQFVLGVHPPSEGIGARALDGIDRGLVRQRDDRVLLVADAGGAPRSADLADAGRARERDLRVPGDLPQPAPASQRARDADEFEARQLTVVA
jgi:putative transposase